MAIAALLSIGHRATQTENNPGASQPSYNPQASENTTVSRNWRRALLHFLRCQHDIDMYASQYPVLPDARSGGALISRGNAPTQKHRLDDLTAPCLRERALPAEQLRLALRFASNPDHLRFYGT